MSTQQFRVDTELADGALGIVAADGSSATAMIGTSGTGAVNQVYPFAGSDTDTVVSTLGDGDLPDWTAHYLLESQGKTAYAVRGAATTAGAAGAATLISGTGPTVPTFAGAPNEDARVRIKIIASGSETTATWAVSFDNGSTYSATRTAGAAIALGNGTSVTFPAGAYTADAVFGAVFVGPRNSLSDVADAADSLIESPYRFGLVHVLGAPSNAADLVTLMSALDSKANAAAPMGKFPVFILEAPAVDPALLIAAGDGVIAPNVTVCGGFAEIFDSNDRRVEKVSIARNVAARVARNPLSVSAMRRADDSDIEPILPNAKVIFPDGAAGDGTDGFIDSFRLPGLNDARFTTARSIPGQGGAFVANTFTFAGLTSDFLHLGNKRLGNRGREILFDAMWRHAQRRIPPDPTTGFISETAAKTIELDARAKLRTLVAAGHATEVSAVMNRSDNISADPVLRIKARVVNVTRAGRIEVNFGLAVALAA